MLLWLECTSLPYLDLHGGMLTLPVGQGWLEGGSNTQAISSVP